MVEQSTISHTTVAVILGVYTLELYSYKAELKFKSSWRNRLARSTVNREVVGSIPTEDAYFCHRTYDKDLRKAPSHFLNNFELYLYQRPENEIQKSVCQTVSGITPTHQVTRK